MSKGYDLSVSPSLDRLFKAFVGNGVLIGVYEWLIQALYLDLGDQLKGVQLEVIKVEYSGALPWLGIYYEDSNDTRSLRYEIDTAIERLIAETSFVQIIKFLNENRHRDWEAEYKKIME